ncbi:hypothetical protein ONZ43_g592 [Nemania bipapillata]|uniref:Uncharacterized protein n=1 Tax=Nemania bipapillata TaxID=110536 RepID=A0ACC2J7N1_9PEZI|nr:hypothetical protein ONZ43_g592 [Nemania bipapillata]
MATVSHNHANYQGRLAFIQQLLVDQLGLSAKDLERAKVIPIQYDPDCPFKYNNFVYRIELPFTVASDVNNVDGDKGRRLKQPGCVPIPSDMQIFILRLSNPDAEGMNAATRIENEVAIINLSSSALGHLEPNVVPRVFGWESAKSSQGWILQELMPGVPVDETFGSMDLGKKRRILAQMVTLLKALQRFPLPESLTAWGGAAFDATNNLLFDPDSGRITALLDYDFASILHPINAKLNGFPTPLPETTEGGIQWDLAKVWEDELEKQDVKRPSIMQGIDKVADVDAVLRAVLPWHITNLDFLQMQPDGATEYFRKRGEEKLIMLLDYMGF